MITDKMADALNEQINAELRSAYMYLAMSLEADSIALKGVANWFYVQCQEEQDHARIFQKYLLAQDRKVELRPVDTVPVKWKSPVDMFRDALVHEKKVTRLIHELVTLAYKEGDYATLDRLQWFVKEQMEEEEAVRNQVAAFARLDEYPEMVGFVDTNLIGRTYKPADPIYK